MTQPDRPAFQESDISFDSNWEILPSATRRMVEEGRALLLDCREADERAVASIEPSLFVPMGEVGSRLPEIEDAIEDADDARLIVYCHHGRRSFQVAVALRERGVDDALSMAGGIDAWSVCVDPTVPRY